MQRDYKRHMPKRTYGVVNVSTFFLEHLCNAQFSHLVTKQRDIKMEI